jgi:hypothetical protein
MPRDQTPEAFAGYTYAAVLVRLEGAGAATPDDVLAALADLRFSGWVGTAGGYVVAVPARGNGVVAAGGRGVLGLAEALATRFASAVVAVRVVADRQLLLSVWSGGAELGRYVSDPSHGLDDKEVLSEPLGAEHAEAFAAAVGRPEAAEDLAELLGEEVDPDSVIESERLTGVVRLLGLPSWLVSVASLPRDVPGGPRARELTRLRTGRRGLAGRASSVVTEQIRGRRRPPPAVIDPPRGSAPDPWLF